MVHIVNGTINVEPIKCAIAEFVEGKRVAVATACEALVRTLDSVNGETLDKFMISISNIASLDVEDTPAHCICRCLVWEVTNIIEKRYIAAAGGVNNVRGTKR